MYSFLKMARFFVNFVKFEKKIGFKFLKSPKKRFILTKVGIFTFANAGASPREMLNGYKRTN